MRRRIQLAAVLLILVSGAAAKKETAAELKSRADAARGGDQAKLCVEYAHVQLEHANELFTAGDVDHGQAEIREVLEYAHKAAEAAKSSGKRLKQTEIELRRLQHRMHDIGESLTVDDRPAVRKAVEEIEQVRADLLAKMFGEKAEPKEKS